MITLSKPETLERLLDRLDARSQAVRKLALEEAKQLPSDTLRELIALETIRYHRKASRNTVLQWIGFGLMVLDLLAYLLMQLLPNLGFFRQNWYYGQAALLVSIATIVYPLTFPQRARQLLSDLVDQSEDPLLWSSALSMATETDGDVKTQRNSKQALKRLLTMRQTELATPFNEKEQQLLLRLLAQPYEDVELSLLILASLGENGRKAAMHRVIFLAEDGAPTPKMKQVQAAAQRCLARIKERTEQDN